MNFLLLRSHIFWGVSFFGNGKHCRENTMIGKKRDENGVVTLCSSPPSSTSEPPWWWYGGSHCSSSRKLAVDEPNSWFFFQKCAANSRKIGASFKRQKNNWPSKKTVYTIIILDHNNRVNEKKISTNIVCMLCINNVHSHMARLAWFRPSLSTRKRPS